MALRDWVALSNIPATAAATATDSAKRPSLLADVATVATMQEGGGASSEPRNADVERRRAKALALLDAEPLCHVAVVAEPGDPMAHVAVAIRGAAVGELEIAADRYESWALPALMQQHGHA